MNSEDRTSEAMKTVFGFSDDPEKDSPTAKLLKRHNGQVDDHKLRSFLRSLDRRKTNQAFLKELDTNGDGKINFLDMRGALTSWYQQLDTNGDGKVDLKDIPDGASETLLDVLDTNADGKVTIDDLPSEARYAFLASFDRNGDGKVDIGDLPPAVGQAMLANLDLNGDGKVTLADLPDGLGSSFLRTLDRNGDGKVSFDDLPSSLDWSLLQVFDMNGDGKVDLQDVPLDIADRYLVSGLDANGDGEIDLRDLPVGTGNALVQMLDRDGDGKLDFSEDLTAGMRHALLEGLSQGGAAMDLAALTSSMKKGIGQQIIAALADDDGMVNVSDIGLGPSGVAQLLQGGLKGLGMDQEGDVQVDEIVNRGNEEQVVDSVLKGTLMVPPPPPREQSPPSLSSTTVTILVLLGLSAFATAVYFGYRYVKKKSLDTMSIRMISADAPISSATMASYEAPSVVQAVPVSVVQAVPAVPG